MIAARLDPKRYAKLLSATLPAIIETEEQNEHYLGVVEELMPKLSFELLGKASSPAFKVYLQGFFWKPKS